jgi:putative ATP-dependent endonuclease of OLD family
VKIARVRIRKFRGIEEGEVFFDGHTVLVGDNNTGKSTILEAIDLVLGPERLRRRPVVDEHDFYAGIYIDEDNPVDITVEVVIIGLSDEQTRHFRDHLEWWDRVSRQLLDSPPPEGTDEEQVEPALRVEFVGSYDSEEDDFVGQTFFSSPILEDGGKDLFRTMDKRKCGYLFLRTLRTGSRALSLERGSLLDIILKLQEKRLQMWEDVLEQIREIPVAEKPELGITDILESVQEAIRGFVPTEWAENPRMRVSDLTRESLRRSLTVFMGTGAQRPNGTEYSAPFQHQGTGTINTLVLALLSLIAELKQNVIFAMEEPEIAIPPHTQKRIINSVRDKSAQAIFTSHSPFVLEEFPPEQVLVLRRENGSLTGRSASLPPAVKPKAYREEFRKRFCEALLARRILIAEGRTEYDAFTAAARRLHDLHPDEYKTLEALGIAVISANSDSQIAPLGKHFTELGKTVLAVYDQQESAQRADIEAAVEYTFEATETSFEAVMVDGANDDALRRYAVQLVSNGEWPSDLAGESPDNDKPINEIKDSLRIYFKRYKGAGAAADFLAQCTREEMPSYVVDTLSTIKTIVEPEPQPDNASESDAPDNPSEDPAEQ